MLKSEYPFYLANRPQTPNTDLAVTDKYTGETATRVPLASPEHIDAAIAAADAAAAEFAAWPAHNRQAVLRHCVDRFTERHEEFSQALCVEAGKPIKDARGETTRLIDSFRLAADECTRDAGSVLTMDVSARALASRVLGWHWGVRAMGPRLRAARKAERWASANGTSDRPGGAAGAATGVAGRARGSGGALVAAGAPSWRWLRGPVPCALLGGGSICGSAKFGKSDVAPP